MQALAAVAAGYLDGPSSSLSLPATASGAAATAAGGRLGAADGGGAAEAALLPLLPDVLPVTQEHFAAAAHKVGPSIVRGAEADVKPVRCGGVGGGEGASGGGSSVLGGGWRGVA